MRFPENWEHIRRLAEEDTSFLCLCSDHALAIGTLQYWKNSKLPTHEERVKEYESLVSALEEEIRVFLSGEFRTNINESVKDVG